MERVCWIPSIAPTKPSETGVLIGGRGNAIAVGAGSGMSIVPLLLGPGLGPQKPFYRPDIGGLIREMSTPASLSWRRYGSNDVLNGVSAGLASALR